MWTGWSLLSRGSRGAHGHVPVEWTHGSARPLHRVGKHGHLLQHHLLANLDDMLSRESRPLCEKALANPSAEGGGLAPATSGVGSAGTLQHQRCNACDQGRVLIITKERQCVVDRAPPNDISLEVIWSLQLH